MHGQRVISIRSWLVGQRQPQVPEALLDDETDQTVGVEDKVLVAGVLVPDDGVQTCPVSPRPSEIKIKV